MSWTVADDIGIVIGIVAGVIAIVGFMWGVTRWVIRRARWRAAPPVEPTTAHEVEASPHVPSPPIVIVPPASQVPYQGGAVSTMPGPGGTTAITSFQTLGEAGAGSDMPGPASQPRIKVSDSDSGRAEDLP